MSREKTKLEAIEAKMQEDCHLAEVRAAELEAQAKREAEAKVKQEREAEEVRKSLQDSLKEVQVKRQEVDLKLTESVKRALQSIALDAQALTSPEQEANEMAERINEARKWAESKYKITIQAAQVEHLAALMAAEVGRINPEQMRVQIQRAATGLKVQRELEAARKPRR